MTAVEIEEKIQWVVKFDCYRITGSYQFCRDYINKHEEDVRDFDVCTAVHQPKEISEFCERFFDSFEFSFGFKVSGKEYPSMLDRLEAFIRKEEDAGEALKLKGKTIESAYINKSVNDVVLTFTDKSTLRIVLGPNNNLEICLK